MNTGSETSAAVAFGRFLVLPYRRELLADSQPVKLGGRAFDVLMALIEARGGVVTKDALVARVWPDRIVEENALQSQISALRMALGADRDLVRTVSGRGYQFIGEVRPVPSADDNAGADAVATKPASVVPMTNLPEPLSELIGRDDEIGEMLNLATAHRLVTLTGAGGIGKTRIALALARELLPHFADGVWLAELSPLTDPGLVTATVAAALGLEPAGGEISVQHVAQMLAGRRLLLVLDTCEHVIDAAAALAEAVQRAGSTVHILATSREPLQVEGEWVYPVPPLAVPPENAEGQANSLQYGAVRLFIERARAAAPYFTPDRRNAASIALICRQLDGIPLAIELAAARVVTLGIEGLAIRLEDRLQLLTAGRRTALPRHRTLRAALDWSYGLLAEPERVLLRRLAIFAGPFSLAAASAVATGPELAASDVIDLISSLLTKSLVTARADAGTARYRLLDTTRAYAIEKLEESGERERLARRRAEYYRNLFERAESEVGARPWDEWLGEYACEIDNLRAALDWAFSPGGDASIGIALTIDAFRLLLRLSLPEEVRTRARQALGALGTGGTRDPRSEMRLHAALGLTTPEPPEMKSSFAKVLDLAESLGDAAHQLRAFHGLYFYESASGRYHAALQSAQKFYDLAMTGTDPHDRLIGESMVGEARHLLGDQTSARHHFEQVLTHYAASDHGRNVIRIQDVIRYGADLRVSARMYLARVLWLEGFPNQAMRTAEMSIDEAQATGHATSLCYALALAACPIALWIGDLTAAAQYTGMLLQHSRKQGSSIWGAHASKFQRIIVLRGGDLEAGSWPVHTGLYEHAEPNWSSTFLAGLSAEALCHAGG